MNNKRTKQVFVIAIALVLLIAGSYAWLTLQVTGNKTNVLRAGSLSLLLDDSTSNGITLEKAVPMSDTKGKTTTEYTFTLQNKGKVSANYTIYLDDIAMTDDETRMADSKVKYQLTKNGEETINLVSSLDSRALDSGKLQANTTNTYSLRVWIDENAGNEVMGTIFSTELRVVAEQAKTTTITAMCKRATTLHKELCTNPDTSGYCQADGYTLNSEIEYGSLGTAGVLTSGDAFDCDVNGDGTYDSETERFYYVSDATNGITSDSNTAVLIYYNNVSGGVASNSTSYAYDSSDENWHGPVTAIKQLPTTSQWKTTLTSIKRQITTETGTTSTLGGELPEFSYEDYAARLLTAQEVNLGCEVTVGSYITGELSNKCKYLMENTKYSNANNKTLGGWLETSRTSMSINAWYIGSDNRYVTSYSTSNGASSGIRPAIEVAKSNISY